MIQKVEMECHCKPKAGSPNTIDACAYHIEVYFGKSYFAYNNQGKLFQHALQCNKQNVNRTWQLEFKNDIFPFLSFRFCFTAYHHFSGLLSQNCIHRFRVFQYDFIPSRSVEIHAERARSSLTPQAL